MKSALVGGAPKDALAALGSLRPWVLCPATSGPPLWVGTEALHLDSEDWGSPSRSSIYSLHGVRLITYRPDPILI